MRLFTCGGEHARGFAGPQTLSFVGIREPATDISTTWGALDFRGLFAAEKKGMRCGHQLRRRAQNHAVGSDDRQTCIVSYAGQDRLLVRALNAPRLCFNPTIAACA